MASTNKTPQLGLNQWAAGDPVLREDFNGDNMRIEEKMLLFRPVFGSAVGDGKDFQDVNLGFYPKFIMVYFEADKDEGFFLALNGKGCMVCSYATNHLLPAHFIVTENGFRMCSNVYGNILGRPIYYLAFH